ncbi:MAG: ParB/RepB/Spo0J family partition protein [Bacteriovoracaceae bacterium]
MSKKPVLGKGIESLLKSNATASFIDSIKEEEAKKISAAPHITAALLEKTKEKKEAFPEGDIHSSVLTVDINKIVPNVAQPRKIFKEQEIEELASSIKINGIIQPLVVSDFKDGKFELIAGERRLRAAKKAGLDKVPVIVKKVTDREKLVIAVIENVQRRDLNCIEEALAYFQLMQDFHLTQDDVAEKIGKDRSTIANFLRILKLPREVIDHLQKEKISFGHAKILASLKDDEQIKKLANLCLEKNLSVRELEDLIKKDPSIKPVKKSENEFNGKLDHLRKKLEERTGFPFKINAKKNGSGIIQIRYGSDTEFNDIYDYLMKAKH